MIPLSRKGTVHERLSQRPRAAPSNSAIQARGGEELRAIVVLAQSLPRPVPDGYPVAEIGCGREPLRLNRNRCPAYERRCGA
ncbi:hypothetical protein GCM10022220_20130 [Actinocatenispora rupis]|uniref:Uncharacterized protein n=1 Tax=Actinocatenispora rupis TaxID=519421 RepID=A0A8J3NBG8_9ACTN|nr:hypothetical protein Aru02nite_16640 [Actinocatenispora rupis]